MYVHIRHMITFLLDLAAVVYTLACCICSVKTAMSAHCINRLQSAKLEELVVQYLASPLIESCHSR